MNWKEFGPRLGFAYRAFDGKKTFVVRGGYRMSYYPMRLQEWILGQSDSAPVGCGLPEHGEQHGSFAGWIAELWACARYKKYIAGVDTPDSIIDTNDHAPAVRALTMHRARSHSCSMMEIRRIDAGNVLRYRAQLHSSAIHPA